MAPKGTVDPSIDMKMPPPVQVDKMDVATFFARFAEVLKDNPPSEDDYPTVHRMERVGLVPGKTPEIKSAFERGTADAKKAIVEDARRSGPPRPRPPAPGASRRRGISTS